MTTEDRWTRELRAWEGWVGGQTVPEFLAQSRLRGYYTVDEAVAAYVASLPDLFGEGTHAPEDLANLLASYIRRSQVGIAEIAEILGQRRQTVAQWHARGRLPKPDAALAMGPVWTIGRLEPWLTDMARREHAEIQYITEETVRELMRYQAILYQRGALGDQEQAMRERWVASLPDPLRTLARAVIAVGRDARIWRAGETTVAIGRDDESPATIIQVPIAVAETIEAME